MSNLNKKRMISDLLKSMVVMVIGLPMATGLLYVMMVIFSHAPVFSVKNLNARYHETHSKKLL
jgi:hypothetical protein